MSADPFIVSIDIGSSSVRALLFDSGARQMEGYGAQLAYRIHTTPDGGAEVDPETLAELTIDCLDELHRQIEAADFRIVAVAGSAFWHSFCGVDATGQPTLPILHLLDTRSGDQVARVPDARTRTGCVPHSSYWPAKLLWLAANRPDEFRETHRFLSFPEYLFLKLFGRATASTSMVSATGLWDQNKLDYDQETLAALPIRPDQLTDPASLDQSEDQLLPEYRDLWPEFAKARWFPALGDGACNNLGSGCVSTDRAALMVGTTGAMRLVSEAPQLSHIAWPVVLPRRPATFRHRRSALQRRRCLRLDEAQSGSSQRSGSSPRSREAWGSRLDHAAFFLRRTDSLLARGSSSFYNRPLGFVGGFRHSSSRARIDCTAFSRNLPTDGGIWECSR